MSDTSGQQDRESTLMGGSLCLTHLDSRTIYYNGWVFVSDTPGQQDRESTIMGGSLYLTHLDSRTENLL